MPSHTSKSPKAEQLLQSGEARHTSRQLDFGMAGGLDEVAANAEELLLVKVDVPYPTCDSKHPASCPFRACMPLQGGE